MNRYIKYAVSMALAAWLTDKIMDKIDEHTSDKKH